MTEQPPEVDSTGAAARQVDPAAQGGVAHAGSAQNHDQGPGAAAGSTRRRVRRRAERAGTNPAADDAPDVLAPREEPKPGETQHDRWLREQRPPHWE